MDYMDRFLSVKNLRECYQCLVDLATSLRTRHTI